MEGGAEAAAPGPGLSTVYCGAYRDNQDCGFGLRGAEIARCYEVGPRPHIATDPPARPSPRAFASVQLDGQGEGFTCFHGSTLLRPLFRGAADAGVSPGGVCRRKTER